MMMRAEPKAERVYLRMTGAFRSERSRRRSELLNPKNCLIPLTALTTLTTLSLSSLSITINIITTINRDDDDDASGAEGGASLP